MVVNGTKILYHQSWIGPPLDIIVHMGPIILLPKKEGVYYSTHGYYNTFSKNMNTPPRYLRVIRSRIIVHPPPPLLGLLLIFNQNCTPVYYLDPDFY